MIDIIVKRPALSPTLKWLSFSLAPTCDASLRLGWYIAVLATEYKLLNVQGLDTYQTRKELYYALEAFNRLDLNAESYFNLADPNNNNPNQAINPSSDDLNGFFIRDDMPDNFIDAAYLNCTFLSKKSEHANNLKSLRI